MKRPQCPGWKRGESLIVAVGVEDPRWPGEKFYVCPSCGRSVRARPSLGARSHTPLGRAERLQAEQAYAGRR